MSAPPFESRIAGFGPSSFVFGFLDGDFLRPISQGAAMGLDGSGEVLHAGAAPSPREETDAESALGEASAALDAVMLCTTCSAHPAEFIVHRFKTQVHTMCRECLDHSQRVRKTKPISKGRRGRVFCELCQREVITMLAPIIDDAKVQQGVVAAMRILHAASREAQCPAPVHFVSNEQALVRDAMTRAMFF